MLQYFRLDKNSTFQSEAATDHYLNQQSYDLASVHNIHMRDQDEAAGLTIREETLLS